MDESVIKPKIRVKDSSLVTEIDLGGKYPLSSMPKSGHEDAPEANNALLWEFKIQADGIMYIQLPGYDDFRGFDLPNESDLSAISSVA